MNDNRSSLSQMLHNIEGVKGIYYQPPNGTEMKYPCIVYERDDIRNVYADDNVYLQHHMWKLTVIDKDPDSEIVQQVSLIRGIKFDRHFASDGLNHDIFTLFF